MNRNQTTSRHEPTEACHQLNDTKRRPGPWNYVPEKETVRIRSSVTVPPPARSDFVKTST